MSRHAAELHPCFTHDEPYCTVPGELAAAANAAVAMVGDDVAGRFHFHTHCSHMGYMITGDTREEVTELCAVTMATYDSAKRVRIGLEGGGVVLNRRVPYTLAVLETLVQELIQH